MRRNSLGWREMTRGRRSLRARRPAAIMHPAKWRAWRGRGDEGPNTADRAEFETLGFGLIFPPPVPFPQASFSPTHAAPQHKKIAPDQSVEPCWKNGQPSSFRDNPPIRREIARLFRPRTIKVSGKNHTNAREFPSPPRAESMFAASVLASPARFELTAPRLGIWCSILLSYGDTIGVDSAKPLLRKRQIALKHFRAE